MYVCCGLYIDVIRSGSWLVTVRFSRNIVHPINNPSGKPASISIYF